MTRLKGSRNKRYEEERERLAAALFEALNQTEDLSLSFRQMADACEVSPSTLRHYFTNRKGALKAAIQHAGKQGEPYLEMVEEGEFGPPQESLLSLLRYLHFGWSHSKLGDLHRLGLEAGLGDQEMGPAYLRNLLEPSLKAFERRISLHIERGELRPCNARYAALSLVSPLFLLMLHQEQLFGACDFPVEIDAFIQHHTKAFVNAHLFSTVPLDSVSASAIPS